MDDLVIGNIELGAIVVSMVEGLKELGILPEGAARWAIGIGMVLAYALVQFSNAYPEYNVYLIPVVTAVVLFLNSAGIYRIGKATGRALKAKG